MNTRNRVLGAVLVVLLVVMVVGLVVTREDDGRDAALKGDPIETTTTMTDPQPPTSVPIAEPYASLAAVLPATLPGYEIDTGAKATGSLDFEAAVNAESDRQAERALLETRGFKAGYGRAFTKDSEKAGRDSVSTDSISTDGVYMVVYELADEENARLYLADGFINLYGKGARVYDVTNIPGGQGFSQGTTSDGRPVILHGVGFAKGSRFVLVFTRSADTSTPEEAKQLALSLYAKA